jgi:hypothetical protein
MFMCPVCGFDRMLRPAAVGYICPCCGVEFEVDDYELGHGELRRQWIAKGMLWFSRITPSPAEWDPSAQLNRAGYGVDPSLVNPQVTSGSRREASIWIPPYSRRREYFVASAG